MGRSTFILETLGPFFAATGKKQDYKAENQNKFFHRISKRLKGKIVVLQSKQRKH
jgi:fructoselysine-6-P-deglycase FrlB-like protein